MATVNLKAAAWDIMGGEFWRMGRPSSRPSLAEIDFFLTGVESGSAIAIVGASTKALIEVAVTRGFAVTVFDFSPTMCADLEVALSNAPMSIELLDITAPIAPRYGGRFDAIISDRLINRFTKEETQLALREMLRLTRNGGQVRTSVKLGYYLMDERMIAEGKRRGVLERFFDADTCTIDFDAAGDVLDAALVPHGSIRTDLLLSWYRGRGRESRYSEIDVVRAAEHAADSATKLELVRSEQFPDSVGTTGFIFQARRCVE